MTAIITVAESKRRSRKNNTAINLSAAIADKGRKTLLIDLDPQANSTIAFYNSGEISTSMFDVLSDTRATMATVIKPTKDPNLFLGPGRLALGETRASAGGTIRRAIPVEGCAGACGEGIRLRGAGYAAVFGNFDGERPGLFDAFACADSGGVTSRLRVRTICWKPTSEFARGRIRI